MSNIKRELYAARQRGYLCPYLPENEGIKCTTQGYVNGQKTGCAKCGWNPAVAERRHKELCEKSV